MRLVDVKFLDALLGRTKPKQPDLDQLFGLPQAALTLQASTGFMPTGSGAVCYRAAEGGAFQGTEADVQQLLDADQGPPVERTVDDYGFTWLVVNHDPTDSTGLVTDLHAVNSALEGAGFGPALLCSMVSFRDREDRPLALVYLYKRGTFYPFAPQDPRRQVRDNPLELQVRGLIGNDLRLEDDLSKWMAIWGAPGL